MGHEIQSILPVDDSVLRASWHELFVAGDNGVMVEIQSCILSRTVNIRDVPSLHRLINEQAAKCPVPAAPVASMNQLEKDTFSLVVKQIEYDLQALRIAKSKRSTWESSVYHVKLQHKLDQHQKSKDAAKWFMENFVLVMHGESSDGMMRQFQLHRSETISRLRLDPSACVPPSNSTLGSVYVFDAKPHMLQSSLPCACHLFHCYVLLFGCLWLPQANFVFVNWLAPCTIKNSVMSSQASFIASCIVGEAHNFGAALLPIFSYKKGQLWMVEGGAVRSLAMAGLNVDSCWNLCFHKKASIYTQLVLF